MVEGKKITIYTKKTCMFCKKAKEFFEERGLRYEEIDVGESRERAEEMIKRSGRKTVPQIFIGETHIGGYSDLLEWERRGKLEEVLKKAD